MPHPPTPLREDLEVAAERVSGQPDRVLVRAPGGEVHAWLEPDWRLLILLDGKVSIARIARLAAGIGIPTSIPQSAAVIREARRRSHLRDRRRRSTARPPLLDWRPLTREEMRRPLLALPEARYRCERCGESCSAGYETGPLPGPIPVQ